MAAVMDDTVDTNDGTDQEQYSLAKGRSRREKKDKGGRFAALKRLKEAKASGEKLKYEVVDERNVYDEVDEREYSKIVQERQEDDWIVDDDGGGYVEDGREVFDDELNDAPADDDKKGKGKNKKKQNPNIRPTDSKPKNIKSMFAAAAVKPKKISEKTVNLNDDELLGDIMSELQQAPTATLKPASVKSTKTKAGARVTSNPFATKVTPKRPNPVKSITPRNVSNEFNSMGRKKYEIESKKAKITPSLEEMDSSVDISEFNTEEMNAASESIEMDDTDTGKENEVMDVSGIDFEDDFGQENVKAAVAESKPSIKAAVPDSGFLENVTTNWSGSRGEPIIPASEVQVDSSQLPLTTENGETFLRMYWLDAYEDHYKQPGIVYLFGKVWIESAKAHVSCCLAVKNIERKVYLLPRQTRAHPKTLAEDGETPVSFIDVYKEFDDTTADKYKIMQFKSRKVTRSYSFEKEDIPAESEYMEVRYPADKPALPQDLKGETFSAVFGSNTSSLENFLLDRKLKGPCWIDIKRPELPNPPISWCKVEAAVSNPDFISVTSSTVPLPPVVVMTMNLRTLPNPKNHQNEVIAVSCLVQHKLLMDKPAPKPAFSEHFCAITRPSDCVFPFDFKEKVAQQTSMKIDVMGNERALLGYLLAKIHKIDPDVIVGHDAFSFDIDVLLHRINHNKIPHWSKIGRLKRANMPKLSNHFGAKNSSSANATCGRLVSDVKISAKELIRCRSYDLNELVNHILKEKRIEIDVDIIRQQYANSSHLLKFVELTLVDSTYILRIMYELMVLPLALQITNICGNVMARTLMGGRAERNEYLLLHAFTEKNFIVPDKSYGKKQVVEEDVDEDDPDHGSKTKKSGRRKPAYAGGLVLEPKKGFYDKFILLLDFNSLYPSIIQEYNICFTTITKDTNTNAEDEEVEPILPDPGLEPGVLPTEIRKLVQSRKQVKQLMKLPDLSHELYMQYDIRQKALKLTANSMYGCLGFTFSRFYAKPLAALVTGKGREILMQTKDLVQGMNLDVIYGDTDSIMVNSNSTDLDEVFKLGNKIKTEVNKLYKLLEIDIDGVFKSMLLLKKKKYAALTAQKVGDKIVYKEELKGLDIVRRDWCSLAKQAGEYVVKQILSGESRELILENIHGKLMDVAEQVEGGNLEVGLFEITKSLTKNPEDYPDKKSLPHVQVALRMNSKGGKKLRSGDAVYYVVCDDGSKLPPSQRAYHPEELAKRDDLKLDTKYYLSNQIHPVVSRLCDPIDGTDAARIAECLGLDPSGYRQSINVREQGEDDGLLAGGLESDDDKYRNCEPFLFKCPTCSKENIIDAVYGGAEELLECKFDKCANNVCGKDFGEYMPLLFNRLSLVIRKNIKKYYEGWLKCEDTACAARTRKVPLIIFKGHPQCPVCRKGRMHPEYTDGMLYRQLCYYRNIFDIDKALATYKNGNTKEARKAENLAHMHRNVYHQIMQYVDKKIRQSAYSEVDLSRLFQGLAPLK